MCETKGYTVNVEKKQQLRNQVNFIPLGDFVFMF